MGCAAPNIIKVAVTMVRLTLQRLTLQIIYTKLSV